MRTDRATESGAAGGPLLGGAAAVPARDATDGGRAGGLAAGRQRGHGQPVARHGRDGRRGGVARARRRQRRAAGHPGDPRRVHVGRPRRQHRRWTRQPNRPPNRTACSATRQQMPICWPFCSGNRPRTERHSVRRRWCTLSWGAHIVLLTKTGPRCISFRCKITVSLAQGAVDDAEADVADPVFVRSTIFYAVLIVTAPM